MTTDGDGAGSPGKQKRDWLDKATLWTAIAGVIFVAAATGVSAWTAFLIKGQLEELKSADPVALHQSDAAVSLSNTASKELVAAQTVANSAAAEADAAKDQVAEMRQAVAAERDQVGVLRKQAEAASRTAEATEQAFLRGSRPILVLLHTAVTQSGDEVTVTYNLTNTGAQTAFLDFAGFQFGPTLEFSGNHQPPIEQMTSCPMIWGVRAVPVGEGFALHCARRISPVAAALLRVNGWMKLKGEWRYHSQTGAQWDGGDVEVCFPANSFCGPPPDAPAFDRPLKGSWDANAIGGISHTTPAATRTQHQR